MKKIYTLLVLLALVKLSFAQLTLPLPYTLATSNYSFTAWDSTSAIDTYPANMVFHYTISSESVYYNHLAEGARDFDCPYDLTSRNRILGREDSGIAFLATSSAQYDDCSGASTTADTNRYVGDAVLAVNTTGITGVEVKWTGVVLAVGDGSGGTAPARQATIRLQYRVGASGNYTDVVNNGTDTIECNTTGKVVGDTVMPIVTLPSNCNNQALVYIRWVYFAVPTTGAKGTRPEIALDDIAVGTGALPLSLLSFGVANSNGAAALSWKTASEVNVSHFEVERSSNGTTFSSVATVAAKGGAANNVYSLIDTKVAAGTSYYRLKMVDRNGSFSYSSVVRFSATGTGTLAINPNPVVTSSFVLTHPLAGKSAFATVFGFDGKKIASYRVKESNTQTTINTTSLSKGNYLLLYTDGNQKLSIKFTKN